MCKTCKIPLELNILSKQNFSRARFTLIENDLRNKIKERIK